MRSRLGYTDATLTVAGADNGIDVVALHAVAQVKHLRTSVGQPDIQRLVGANEGRVTMLFYSSSGYSQKAVEYANRAGVALFRFDLPGGPAPVNEVADALLE